jgi:hypothetical protein
MELAARIELATFSLPTRCSTTELRQLVSTGRNYLSESTIPDSGTS